MRVHPSVSRTPIPSHTRDASTVCVLCSHNCGLKVDVEDGRITAVRPDESNPITEGYACNKGFSIARYADHKQRTTQPLKRQPNGDFEPISWEQAIAEIGDRLLSIREQHGPRAISLVGVGGQANHMDAPYALGFLSGLGSRRWFNAFAQEKTQHMLVDGWMMQASPGLFLHADVEHTACLLVLGTNPKVSHRGEQATRAFSRLKKRDDATLIVVDPRRTETARSAHLHLRVRPGCDAFLLTGMAAHITQSRLVDTRFLEQRTRGWPTLSAVLEGIDVDAMARHAGVPAESLRQAAETLARAPSAAIFFDLGVEQIRHSTLAAYLIRVLINLTGNLGRRGGNVFLESFNPPGSGRPRGEPERALVSGIPAIRALGNYGMFSPNLFPEEVLVEHPERIRAVIVEGSNPLLSFADTHRWREAFDALELKVVIDPAFTETAALADYVLPTPVGYEKWEVCGFPKSYPEIYGQLRPPILAPPPQALPEPEIYARLAEHMKLFGPAPRILERLASHLERPGVATTYTLTAMVLARLAAKRSGGGTQNRILFWSYRTLGPKLPAPSLVAAWFLALQNAIERRREVLDVVGPKWRFKTPFALGRELFRRLIDHPEGVLLARLPVEDHLERIIEYSDGRIRLDPQPMIAALKSLVDDEPRSLKDFPLALSAGFRTRWTANTIHRDPAWRKGKGPHCTLHIHPEDAATRDIAEGDAVRVVTRAGEVTLAAEIDDGVLPGQVAIPNSFAIEYPTEAGVVRHGVELNALTSAEDRDPFTGVPWHKCVPCQVALC